MVYGLYNNSYQLENKPFSSGGEGDIYGIVGMRDRVVKVYHANCVTSELEQKLVMMTKRPPSSKVLTQVAWPIDVVYDQNRRFCGFVMPRLSINAELSEIYVYPPKTNITNQQKLIIGQNICAVISEVHKAGYIFGDFNPRNIGVDTNTGTVAFLDTDSYHIVLDKANNKAFRCNVCAPGYAAPELLERCAQHVSKHPEDSKRAYAATPLDTFTVETDNFALAIHMFKLLMNGFTPFGGIKETESASVGSPGVGDAAVRRDSYCFKPGNKPQAPAVPPLEILPQEIADLFTRAFLYGKIDPKQRPSALEWYKALLNYEKALKVCSKDRKHMYLNTLHTCPWCEADARYAASMQPSITQRQYTAPVQPVYTPTTVTNTNQTTNTSANASNYTNVGAGAHNAYNTGGSTYRQTNTTQQQKKSFFARHWGWLAGIAAVFVVFLLIKSCINSLGNHANSSTGYSYQTAIPASPTTKPTSSSQNGSNNQTYTDVPSPTEYIRPMTISEIATVSSSIDPISDRETTIGSIGIDRISGNLYENNQVDEYSFIPDISGTYRFEFADIPDGTYVSLYFRNSYGEYIDSNRDIGNGSGLTMTLSQGTHYIIQVCQYRNFGNYNLLVGKQKATVDISAYTKITDSIEYNYQENNYIFTPDRDGVYRLEMADIADGTDVSLYIYNMGWEYLDSNRDIDNGSGLTMSLTGGKSYYISVKQYRNVGSYSLLIGKQKETIDISSYTIVHDSIQYSYQENNYIFTADVGGTYRFEFAQIQDGTDMSLYIYNSGWEYLDSNRDIDNGEGITIDLSEKQTVYVSVKQYRNTGEYALLIGKQKPMVDISNEQAVSDSIQYYAQRNMYKFTASSAGQYRFELLNIIDGTDFSMYAYNTGWEYIDSNRDIDDGEGLTLNLAAGQTIYLVVQQYRSTGPYSFIIKKQ